MELQVDESFISGEITADLVAKVRASALDESILLRP
jgi:hypothetical protein